MTIATVGLDIAKQFFQVHGVDAESRVVLCKKLRRNQVASFFANLSPCVVGPEARYWARVLLTSRLRSPPPRYSLGRLLKDGLLGSVLR
jgi:hypothetical protein